MDIKYPVDENDCITYDDLIAAHDAYLEKILAEWEAKQEYLEEEL